MDNFLGESETCHPCDNFASALAAAGYAGASGRDFLTSLAAAYQVQCKLARVAPIMQRGFDHTTQLAFSIPAGVCRALSLNAEQAANAVGIGGAGQFALAVIRAVPISQWKGLASSQTALGCVHAAFLARRGGTGLCRRRSLRSRKRGRRSHPIISSTRWPRQSPKMPSWCRSRRRT